MADSENTSIPNIILFGSTGSGKSSIVNMIADSPADRPIANMSSGATGCTFKSDKYQCRILGSLFNIYDTAGLDEGGTGTVPREDAIVQLYQLIRKLDTGVSLLVYCMRAPRIQDSAHKNWKLFYEVFCREKVPIVIIITGLEHEDPMDDWWDRNKGAFQRNEMRPSGFACTTATRGKRKQSGKYQLEEEYSESQEKVWKLIKYNHLEEPWKVEKIEWFTYMMRCLKRHKEAGPPIHQLVTRCEMTEEEAIQLANKLKE
ncbi:hypothetical protein SERLADRAFT_402103 [Serpula lacrymans var. lacrymans S7.9]|nr:uncharacterized protein SERLADRAFT_402103 [Serpula lacrymans var. lacrymans S7.9]EGO19600.1 hypothetical protein SERLADRAFT_402103 [Serpula lacrymans var. lacrymans S7.9]